MGTLSAGRLSIEVGRSRTRFKIRTQDAGHGTQDAGHSKRGRIYRIVRPASRVLFPASRSWSRS
jgi:hypothetical protein